MAKTDLKSQLPARLFDIITGAEDLHFLLKAFTDTGNHIVNQGTHSAMQLPVLAVLRTLVFDDYFSPGFVNFNFYPRMTVHLEFAKRARDLDTLAFQVNLYATRYFNRFISNTTH
jgi:hypothetical protein